MRILLAAVLASFSLYTAWIVWEFGYTSVFEVTLREHPSTQALLDLLIACSLLFFLIIADNHRAGRPFRKVAPFAIVTVLFGAIGPLLYFLVYTDLLEPTKAGRGS